MTEGSEQSTKSPKVGYSHIQAIWVCATVKGLVFRQIRLG